MFRKTKILLKINFKLAMTVTVVVEYLKVIDIGPRHIIKKKKRKNSIFRYSFVKLPWNTSNLIFSFFFFFSVQPYRPTHSFLIFFFDPGDNQPTLSLDGKLNTRKCCFFFLKQNCVFRESCVHLGYLNREILPRLGTWNHDILCMISFLCLLNYST